MTKKKLVVPVILTILQCGMPISMVCSQASNVHAATISAYQRNDGRRCRLQTVYTDNPQTFLMQPYPLTSSEQQDKRQLINFLTTKMMTDGSFYTNYLPSSDNNLGDAVGHDCLSESAGIWLCHLALTGTQQQYDTFYQQAKQKFFANGQFAWIVKADGQRANTNASVDDMRIMQSLVMAQARFHNQQYGQELQNLLKTFDKQSLQNGLLVSFYDPTCKYAAPDVALNYLDIKQLGYFDKVSGVPISKLRQETNILKHGYISDQCPLYYEGYNYQTKKYEYNGQINIIHALLSIYHLAQINAAKPQSINFIKHAVATGTLYNTYNNQGQALNNYQSPASYAIAAMIARQINDKQLYQQAIQRMLAFQVHDSNSAINGGIGFGETVFSFNDLMAVLALDC